MYDLYVVASALRVRLESLADLLYGCAHRRRTLPITLRNTVGADGGQRTLKETYVVCLECGRHFPYDWRTMRVGSDTSAACLSWLGLRTIDDRCRQEQLQAKTPGPGVGKNAEPHKQVPR